MQKNYYPNTKKSNTDLVRVTEIRKPKPKKRRIRKKPLFLVFSFIIVVLLTFFTTTFISQNAALQEKRAQKKEVFAKLQQAKEEQQQLKMQIEKLEDDEYIAKVLRRDYFLSEKGEIIFIIPEEGKKADKN